MLELGVQIFGCADIFCKSPNSFFRKISEMGYTKIEPCIVFGSTEEFSENLLKHLWTLDKVDSFVRLMKEYNLGFDSFHAFGNLKDNMDEVKSTIEKYQIKHMVINGPRGDLKSLYNEYLEKVQMICEGIAESEAKLIIHNGSDDIKTKIGEKTFLEAILEECGGKVGAQIDVGWLKYGGEEPVQFLKRIQPYLKSLHYKDLKRGYKELTITDVHVGLGQGILDVRPIYKLAEQYEIPQYIDQDSSDGDLLEDLKKSVELLNSFI